MEKKIETWMKPVISINNETGDITKHEMPMGSLKGGLSIRGQQNGLWKIRGTNNGGFNVVSITDNKILSRYRFKK